MEYSTWFVCVLGVGIVFLGLFCIVMLCKLISFFCNMPKSESKPEVVTEESVKPIKNRQKIVAAVSAVIAEELETDVSVIRVVSFKKI